MKSRLFGILMRKSTSCPQSGFMLLCTNVTGVSGLSKGSLKFCPWMCPTLVFLKSAVCELETPLGKALGPCLACGLLASWASQLFFSLHASYSFLCALQLVSCPLWLRSLSQACFWQNPLPSLLVPAVAAVTAGNSMWRLHRGTRTRLEVWVSVGSGEAVLVSRLQVTATVLSSSAVCWRVCVSLEVTPCKWPIISHVQKQLFLRGFFKHDNDVSFWESTQVVPKPTHDGPFFSWPQSHRDT